MKARLSLPITTLMKRVLFNPRLNRTMSTVAKSAAYILPHEPSVAAAVKVAEVDPAKLWATTPGNESKVGSTRVFFNTPTDKVTTLVSLGENFASKKPNEKRELVRKAVGSAVKQVKGLDGVDRVGIDATSDPHAAAVGAYLSRYKFSLKTKPPSTFKPNHTDQVPEPLALEPLEKSEAWDLGVKYAEAQNFARTLTELPANMLTPTTFAERVTAAFEGIPNVKVIVRDEAWAEEKGMRTFLSVTKGTSEPAKLVEIHYNGASADSKPLAFVGKGITFDSGGISIKPSADMKLMRGDMGGAAAVVSSVLAIAQLQLPVNVISVTPLCENLPGPSANKPGDIIYAMNGKSVEIDNTDAEGRLVLSDALYYVSSEYKPHTLIDVATLTGSMDTALGEIYSGVWSTSDSLWKELHQAGEIEHDRFWRMPLDEEYGPQIYSSNADLCNTGGKPAGCCTAALFLKHFVEGIEGEDAPLRWAHIDIAGSMEVTRPTAYSEKGMSGRPVRALVEFARKLSQQ